MPLPAPPTPGVLLTVDDSHAAIVVDPVNVMADDTTAVTLGSDTFTAADHTLLTAHTADTGQTWVGDTGSLEIIANKLAYISGPGTVAFDVGATGKTVSATIARGAHSDTAGLVPAYVDSNNYVVAFWDGADQLFKLFAVIGGVGAFGAVAAAPTTALSGILSAQLASDTLVIAFDGVTVLTAALTPAQAAAIAGFTKYGIYGSVDVTCDDFHVLSVTTNDIYRRDDPADAVGIRLATGVAANTAWTDYTPSSGVDYGYQVIAVGGNGVTAASGWTSDVPATGDAYPSLTRFPSLTTFPGG